MPPESSRGYRSAAVRRPTACSFISTSCSMTGAGSFVCARSGSATFSPAVRSVSRPLPCSSTPMPLRSSSSSRWRRGTGWPKTSTVPAAGTSSPVSAASRVDLPLPEGPRIAVMLPRGTTRSMSSRMVRAPRSSRTPERRTAGSCVADDATWGMGPEGSGRGMRCAEPAKHRPERLNWGRSRVWRLSPIRISDARHCCSRGSGYSRDGARSRPDSRSHRGPSLRITACDRPAASWRSVQGGRNGRAWAGGASAEGVPPRLERHPRCGALGARALPRCLAGPRTRSGRTRAGPVRTGARLAAPQRRPRSRTRAARGGVRRLAVAQGRDRPGRGFAGPAQAGLPGPQRWPRRCAPPGAGVLGCRPARPRSRGHPSGSTAPVHAACQGCGADRARVAVVAAMNGRSDFRLYHSNALDVLARMLSAELRVPAPGQGLLEPDVVLIPQPAMRRWLQATLAEAHGVAANLEFLTPGEFVQRALDANVPGRGEDLDAAALRWRIHAALSDPAVLRDRALQPMRAYLESAPDPLKAWSLAGELAQAFEKYKAWRREWLLAWEAGEAPGDPQAALWRRVAGGTDHRARRIDAYLRGFAAPGAPLPAGLPKRLFAFAILNVSPDVLRVIATVARVGTLHLYVPSPSRDYWGDLQRVRGGDPDAAAGENPLLRAWGAAGRDFMAVLGTYEVVHPDVEFRGDADPGEGGGALKGSLLRRLQSDLFHRRPSPPLAPTAEDARVRLPTLRRDDPSLQVHACHTRLRELQVLHDQLRALFEDPRFDPPLQPRDVAVLAPDIDPYLPYLDAVFGGRGRGRNEAGFNQAIPYAIADASPLAGEPLADVFLRLLALPVARFGLVETLDLLASPPLAEAAQLDAAAFDRLHAWLHAAGARWGLDAAHRARLDAPADDAYTWAFALDRLLLGHATGSDAPIISASGQIIAPMPELEGSALDALDTLVRLLRVLARHARVLDEALTPDGWRERLLGLLDALLPQPPSSAVTRRALDRLRTLIDDFAADARRAGVELPVPAGIVRAHFTAALSEADTRAPLLTGGVSIARMVPMRLLPFRAICLLGMDDGEFPRRDPAGGLDRLTADLAGGRRLPGDRSTRDDDRFLFLQLFAAAQDVFYVSYQGADPRDGSVREPSVLVADLLAAVDAQHVPEAKAGEALVVRHTLQPFAPAAFGSEDDPRRFSYSARWWPAAV